MPKGSRGGKRGTTTEGGVPIVKYEDWGTFKSGADVELLYDENGSMIGKIEDEWRYINEPDIHPVTKKEVLEDIDAWRMDDGTYGDQDTKIYLAYKDGTFVDADDLNGKAYKKSGIVGASISTGDYEMVWGGEMKNGVLQPWETWSEDGESGYRNSYSGYKAVGEYKARVKTTYNNPNGKGGYKTIRETLQQSTVKPLNNRL